MNDTLQTNYTSDRTEPLTMETLLRARDECITSLFAAHGMQEASSAWVPPGFRIFRGNEQIGWWNAETGATVLMPVPHWMDDISPVKAP